MKSPKSSSRRANGILSKKKTSLPNATEPQLIELVPSFVQLRRILVPVDLSDFTAPVINYALPYALQFGAEVILLHIFEPRSYSLDSIIVPPEMEEANMQMKQRVQQQLDELRAQAVSGRPLQARSLVRSGKPYHEICQAAEALDCDLIILGTHGYTGLKHLYLGSTAERVVRHAPCPVLTVRPPSRTTQRTSETKNK
jgi:universal stress protein A